MMIIGKLTVVLIIGMALGAGAMVIHNELVSHAGTVTSASDPPATSRSQWEAQQRAEQKDEEQTITSDCKALRAMGVTDKDCPPGKEEK